MFKSLNGLWIYFVHGWKVLHDIGPKMFQKPKNTFPHKYFFKSIKDFYVWQNIFKQKNNFLTLVLGVVTSFSIFQSIWLSISLSESFSLSVFWSFSLSVFQSFGLSVFQSFSLLVFQSFSLSFFQSFYLSVFLSFCLSVFLSFCLSNCLSVHPFYKPTVCLSIHFTSQLSVCLSILQSNCLSVYLYVRLMIHRRISKKLLSRFCSSSGPCSKDQSMVMMCTDNHNIFQHSTNKQTNKQINKQTNKQINIISFNIQ